ncbi:hypothetical protein [Rossellomorea aquimaris]|nr:hypothetical protein [Rossellomorea aquimaris]
MYVYASARIAFTLSQRKVASKRFHAVHSKYKRLLEDASHRGLNGLDAEY